MDGLMTEVSRWMANPLYASFLSSGVAALLSAIIGGIWRRSFLWFIGMFLLVVIVTIPLQLFTTQLAPLASQVSRMEDSERFLWINAVPCGVIFLLSLYVMHLASREQKWIRMDAEALALEDQLALEDTAER